MIYPKVSVLLPVYNQEKFLNNTISSILKQTYKNFEIVIGDDNSSDNSLNILQKFKDKYPNKIKLLKNSKNLGVTKNCNNILNHCDGKYISIFFGDDLMYPKKLQKQVENMELDDDIILNYHDTDIKYYKEDNIGPNILKQDKKNKFYKGKSEYVVKKIISEGTSFIVALTIMVQKKYIKKNFNERIKHVSDEMFWIDYLALNPNKKVTFIDEKLSCYIKHDYGITSKNYRSEVFQLINIAKKKYPKYYKDIKKRKKYLFYELAINKFNIKNYEKSIKYLFISIKFGIYSYKILFWIILCLLKIIKKKILPS